MVRITSEMLEELKKGYENDPAARTMTAAASQTELEKLAFLPMEAAKLKGAFSVELKTRGITWQQNSGRCWLFAAQNILRELVAEQCGLESFELSGNYLAFYDKLEKSNNVLEMAIEHAAEALDSKMMETILHGVSDGGHWSMAADLIRKYGIVPASCMPETYQSNHTGSFNRMLNTMIKKDICEIRRIVQEGYDPHPRKEQMLAEIYKMECIAFGQPPRKFDFSYRDKDGEFHSMKDMTPLSFKEEFVGSAIDDYVTVVSEPVPDKEYFERYYFHYIGSMAESNVEFLNLPTEQIEQICIRQLQAGEPIWFGCDSDAFKAREEGVWDQGSFDYNGLFGVDFTFHKKDRLMFKDSFADHAMLLVGVNLDEDNNADRWKIENSWGEKVGEHGYFVCSKQYFTEYVYEVIVNKKYLTQQQLKLWDKPAKQLACWTTI